MSSSRKGRLAIVVLGVATAVALSQLDEFDWNRERAHFAERCATTYAPTACEATVEKYHMFCISASTSRSRYNRPAGFANSEQYQKCMSEEVEDLTRVRKGLPSQLHKPPDPSDPLVF